MAKCAKCGGKTKMVVVDAPLFTSEVDAGFSPQYVTAFTRGPMRIHTKSGGNFRLRTGQSFRLPLVIFDDLVAKGASLYT
jgi:hypothetical protein